MTRLPTLVVVGAPKCGTTALHDFFTAHPGAFVHRPSELHWWSRPELTANVEGPGDRRALRAVCRNRSNYDRAFAAAPPASVVVETSPSYLYWPAVAGRLADNLPEVKVVVVVRDPVQRAWSQYWHQVRAGVETLDFESALEAETSRAARRWGDLWRYVGHSHYAAGVRRYRDTLGVDRVLVLDAETLASEASVARLLDFAGLASSHRPVQHVHGGGVPRSGVFTSIAAAAAPVARAVLPTRLRHRVRDLTTRALTTPVPPVPAAVQERLAPLFAADQAELHELRSPALLTTEGRPHER